MMYKTSSAIANKFIAKVDREASRLSVQLLFGIGKCVLDPTEKDGSEGYFEPPADRRLGTLAIAIGVPRSRWLHTLAHEYAHMIQWSRDDAVYLKWYKEPSEENYIALETYTEAEAKKLIENFKLPCGDHRKRTREYLKFLRTRDES